MQTMINNLINGNLSDARKQAKRRSLMSIRNHLLSLGWSNKRATYAANYLKTGNGFQLYADEN